MLSKPIKKRKGMAFGKRTKSKKASTKNSLFERLRLLVFQISLRKEYPCLFKFSTMLPLKGNEAESRLVGETNGNK